MLDVRALWRLHGTKLIGFVTAGVGALTYLDHETIHVIETGLGPMWGPRVTRGLMVIAGLATAYRGFRNSKP